MKFPLRSNRMFFSLILLSLSLMIFKPVISQEYVDDPNLDQVPKWYLENTQKGGSKASQVITVDGYDNYFLANDFAETHISVNPMEPTQFFTAYNIDDAHGTLDGHDWYDTQVSWGTTIRGDVLTAYDSLGNLYYENMYGSFIQGCKIVRSSDNGQTWNSPVTAISGNDKNWLAADQTGGPYSNYVYSTMTNSGVGNFTRSTDFGQTWNTTFQPATQSLPGMMVCVGAWGDVQGGAVYVVTNGGSVFSSNYTFYQSLDGGATFQFKSSNGFAGYVGSNVNGRHSVQNMRTRPYPFIAADNSYGPYRGRFYLIYASNEPAGNGNKPDIWCRYSDDGGSTWSDDIKVNDDVNTQSNNQFAPAVWCDKDSGRLYVQWMDTRDTPTSDSALIYATYSETGGVDFVPNQQISNEKMKINCTTCGASGSPRYQGDYTSIVSNPRTSMSSWTDFRYGSFGSFTAYFPDFGMLVSPEEFEISGVDTLWAIIPDVKLYDDTVMFSATIEDPASGTFEISFPGATMLTSFPDSIPIILTVQNVPLGNYQLTVRGEGPNGTPVHLRDVNVIVSELLPPVTNFEASATEICAGNSIDFTDLSLNFPNQWFWTFTGGTPSSSNEQNPTGIVYENPGTYDVKLIAANNSGFNELIMENYITVGESPEAPEGESVYVCGEEPVLPLEATGEDIKWYSDPELTNLVFEGSPFETGQTEPGTYVYFVTQTVNGCEGPAKEIMLSIGLFPEASLEPFEAICGNADPIELTGGLPENGTYFGTGVFAGSFDPMVAGQGTATIGYEYTNESLCSDTAYQDIMVYSYPDINLGPDSSICPDNEIVLDATDPAAISYEWLPGNQTSATITVDSTGIGIGSQEFTVMVTDDNGCVGTDAVTVTVNECSGISEITGLSAVYLYPNPNDGKFNLEIVTTKRIVVSISIYDARGQIVSSMEPVEVLGKSSNRIGLSDIKPGIYYVAVENSEGSVSKKFIVR